MNYKLDVMKFAEQYFAEQNKLPTYQVFDMWANIVGFCNEAYQQGLSGKPFEMPNKIPVLPRSSDLQFPCDNNV